MNPLLTTFRNQYLELALNFLWRQWSAVGVAGSAQSENDGIIDPEALLLFTCSMGRYDARLFDEVIDWLHTNGHLINVQRLKRIAKTESFVGTPILSAMAALLTRGEDALKWKRLAGTPPQPNETQPLFFLGNGRPIPVMHDPDPTFQIYGYEREILNLRGYSQKVSPTVTPALLFQLRALFGINARTEILAYLLTHEQAHPSRIARETYYNQKTVQNALVDMTASGTVRVKSSGREKHYWVKPEAWWALLERKDKAPDWVIWPPLFRALELIWIRLNEDPLRSQSDALLVASELRQLMLQVQPLFERAGFGRQLSDDKLYIGEEYLDVFLDDVRKVLS